MNDFDRENLKFLMQSSAQDLEDFYDMASDDDLTYALELVRQAQSELLVQEIELLESVADADVSQATELLKKYRL